MFAFILLALPLLVKGADMSISTKNFRERPSVENLFANLFPNEPFPGCDVTLFDTQVCKMAEWDAREATKILLPCIGDLGHESASLFQLLDMSLKNSDLTLIKLIVDHCGMFAATEAVVHYVRICKLRHFKSLPQDLKDAVNSELPGSRLTSDLEVKLIVVTFLSDYPVGHRLMGRFDKVTPISCSRASLLCQLQVFPLEMVVEKVFRANTLDAKAFLQVWKERQLDLALLSSAQQAILAVYLNEANSEQLSVAFSSMVASDGVLKGLIDPVDARLRFFIHLCHNYSGWTAANVPFHAWMNLITSSRDVKIRLMPRANGQGSKH